MEVTNFATWITSPQYHIKKEWYNKAIDVPFEHIQIPVPSGHDYPFYSFMEEELIKQIRAVGFMGDVDKFCEKVSKGELYI